MKYIPSIAFEEMSGSAKGVTAAKMKNRKYGCGFFRTGFGLHSELHQEFFEVANGEGGDGCCVFDNHFSDD